MLTENDADNDVMNGDIGVIADAYPKKTASGAERNFIRVVFDSGREVEYPAAKWRSLNLAYAITIHKSQGSQYPVVIMPVTMAHRNMLDRSLLYTGWTRAKDSLFLVGEREALQLSVETTEASRRDTRLREFLVAAAVRHGLSAPVPVQAPPAPAPGRPAPRDPRVAAAAPRPAPVTAAPAPGVPVAPLRPAAPPRAVPARPAATAPTAPLRPVPVPVAPRPAPPRPAPRPPVPPRAVPSGAATDDIRHPEPAPEAPHQAALPRMPPRPPPRLPPRIPPVQEPEAEAEPQAMTP